MDNWEIYYRTHAGKVLTGSPPLSFVSNGENLVDYRIYGASGGVGDKTDNLWNEKATTVTNEYIDVNGNIATGVEKRYLYLKVNVSPSTNYVFKWTENVLGTDDNTAYIRISEYTQSNRFIRRVLCNCSEQTQKAFSFTTDSNTSYIDVRTESATSLKGQHLTGVMLITGTIPPETYEPYGYKIPVVCGGTTTNIYLDEPLEENESISMSDTGVSITTINGSNTLSVNTTVQPSSVYVKYATNKRSVPARNYLQGVEEMDNWAIYNYINREGSGALRNESTVTSTTVEVRKTIKFTGAALGGTAPYQYAFYFKRGNAAEWTTKSDYGVATTVDFTPYYVDTYKYKVNVKDSKGTIKSKIFNINVTAAASTTSNMPSLDKLSFDNTDELTVDNDFNRAELTVEDNTSEEV